MSPFGALHHYSDELTSTFGGQVMDHLTSLYETAPLWARAESLADIASVLGRCLEVRLVSKKKMILLSFHRRLREKRSSVRARV